MHRRLKLAHLSDVHLAPVVGFWPHYWGPKRVLGFLNWQGRRRARHRREIVDRLIADVHAQAVDHIAITGDLVNLGLPREIGAAREWLRSVGPAELVSVVPGNHDIYARHWRDPGVARWQGYMTSCPWGHGFERRLAEEAGEDFPAHPTGELRFPYVRRVGEIVIVGLNSARPTPPAQAWGRLGRDQLRRAALLLERLGAEGHFRCVLIHHPPLLRQASAGKRLRDARPFERILATTGAELVLHGHNHVDMLARGPEPSAEGEPPRFTAIGVASASAAIAAGKEPLARYHLYEIGRTGTAWQVTLVRRGLLEPAGPVVEIERLQLLVPAAVGRGAEQVSRSRT
jgi:3',5'-cyclic AMP phosphodiesterase CpdA